MNPLDQLHSANNVLLSFLAEYAQWIPNDRDFGRTMARHLGEFALFAGKMAAEMEKAELTSLDATREFLREREEFMETWYMETILGATRG